MDPPFKFITALLFLGLLQESAAVVEVTRQASVPTSTTNDPSPLVRMAARAQHGFHSPREP